jgi:hypothetical protein
MARRKRATFSARRQSPSGDLPKRAVLAEALKLRWRIGDPGFDRTEKLLVGASKRP